MESAPPERTTEAGDASSVKGQFSAFFGSLSDAFRDAADLLALEARQAGISAALILGLAVAIALLGVTAWLLLVAALVAALANTFLGFAGALGVAAVLNLGAAVPMVLLIRASSANLMFPATRRQLRGAPAPTSAVETAQAER